MVEAQPVRDPAATVVTGRGAMAAPIFREMPSRSWFVYSPFFT